MAFAVVAAISLAVGSMYYARARSKAEDGPASMYHDGGGTNRSLAESDSKMGSAKVRDAMHKT